MDESDGPLSRSSIKSLSLWLFGVDIFFFGFVSLLAEAETSFSREDEREEMKISSRTQGGDGGGGGAGYSCLSLNLHNFRVRAHPLTKRICQKTFFFFDSWWPDRYDDGILVRILTGHMAPPLLFFFFLGATPRLLLLLPPRFFFVRWYLSHCPWPGYF